MKEERIITLPLSTLIVWYVNNCLPGWRLTNWDTETDIENEDCVLHLEREVKEETS